eukprot:2225330-Rhodomonas_salina.2
MSCIACRPWVTCDGSMRGTCMPVLGCWRTDCTTACHVPTRLGWRRRIRRISGSLASIMSLIRCVMSSHETVHASSRQTLKTRRFSLSSGKLSTLTS